MKTQALASFYSMLAQDQDRACYGYKAVRYATEEEAVATLLISDKLFKAKEVAVRRQYVDLVEAVDGRGGKVSK